MYRQWKLMGTKLAIEPESLEAFLPAEAGLRAHCRRVAALARRVAANLGMSGSDANALAHAALVHHYPAALLKSDARERLMADLNLPAQEVKKKSPQLPGEIASILLAFHGDSGHSSRAEMAGRVLDFCNIFDEEIESLPYEARGAGESVDQFLSDGGPEAKAIQGLRTVRAEDLAAAARRLPEVSLAAMQQFDESAEVISGSEAMTSAVLRMANSAFFAPAAAATNVRDAVGVIGPELSQRVLAAFMVQPFFASQSFRYLWSHSLEVAEWAARLAEAAIGKQVNSADAFLGALLHDLGILAMHRLEPERASEYRWWKENGCPATYAEILMCGRDHGSVGADILRNRKFPESIAEAVEFHHTPELSRNPLAAILYLAEIQTGAEEDLPSSVRRFDALQTIGLSEDEFENMHVWPTAMALIAKS